MSQLQEFVDLTVSLITCDGRHIVGILRGFDQMTNVVLDSCHERLYSLDGVETVPLGVYIIRGDNVAVVGELDPDLDKKIDFSSVRAEPLKPVVH